MKLVETTRLKFNPLVPASIFAAISAFACSSGVIRRIFWPLLCWVSVFTCAPSWRLTTRKVMAMKVITESRIRVMTSAMPCWELRFINNAFGINVRNCDTLAEDVYLPGVVDEVVPGRRSEPGAAERSRIGKWPGNARARGLPDTLFHLHLHVGGQRVAAERAIGVVPGKTVRKRD